MQMLEEVNDQKFRFEVNGKMENFRLMIGLPDEDLLKKH